MATFLTPNTQFKPFSYQEMLAPVLAYKEAYDEAEKELNTLEENAAAQAFTFKGSEYENTYDAYVNSLSNISDEISRGNLSNVKNQIKDARKTFLNTLAPAAQRITKLNALRDKQNTEQANNPFIRFSVDYRNASEKDITANSSYSTYDLSKIYDQVAKNTLSRIASDYRPQVGDPVKISGTNSYMVKHGYGMTQEEYEAALLDSNSDLNKYITSEIQKATNGITDQKILNEITKGVRDTIKSNIGKFEQTKVEGTKSNYSDFLRNAEAMYKYKWGYDENGHPIILGKSDQWFKDNGWEQDDNGEWYKPRSSSEDELYHPKLNQDPSSGYEGQIPSYKGGEKRVRSMKLDTRLTDAGRDKLEEDIKNSVGDKIRGVKKFTFYDLVDSGATRDVKDLKQVIKALSGDNYENAKYYDFYYSDDMGIGGTLYSVLKDEKDIKEIINSDYIADLKNSGKNKGIIKQGDNYYFIDSDGKFLLGKNKHRIELHPLEIEKYKKEGLISDDVKSGKRIFFNGVKEDNPQNDNPDASSAEDTSL